MIEKNVELGVLGGVNKNKAGDTFVKIMKEGGGVMTIRTKMVKGAEGHPFPSLVKLSMLNCEQKFSNYGDSFWNSEGVVIEAHVLKAAA